MSDGRCGANPQQICDASSISGHGAAEVDKIVLERLSAYTTSIPRDLVMASSRALALALATVAATLCRSFTGARRPRGDDF